MVRIENHPGALVIGALVIVAGLKDFGTCRLKGVDGDRVWLRSFSMKKDVQVSTRSQTILRFELLPGTKVRWLDPDKPEAIQCGFVVEKEDSSDGDLYAYRIQSPEDGLCVLSEADLVPLTGTGPVEFLRSLNWGHHDDLYARWALQDVWSRWCEGTSGLPGILGARIKPLGHQLYTAQRVLWDRLPRFVLADEVGLGKTIEAGLILQGLLSQDPELRILVVAPGSMSRQWLQEIYLRFGARAFAHVDTHRLRAQPTSGWKQLAKARGLIVSSTALATEKKFAELLAEQSWGVVVIDEAHQFPPGSTLYTLFQTLAQRAPGLLLLSATPSKRDVASLAGLLALIAPDAYAPDDGELLVKRQDEQEMIWDRLNFTRNMLDGVDGQNEQLDEEELGFVADEWDGVLPDDDATAASMIERMRDGDTAAAHELVAYVQEFYRLDHRIIRNRRKTLRQIGVTWAPRSHTALDYEPTRDEAIFIAHMHGLPIPESDTSAAALIALYWRFAASTPGNALKFLRARHEALSRQDAAFYQQHDMDDLDWLLADPGPVDELLVMNDIINGTPPFPGELAWLRTAVMLAGEWVDGGKCARITRGVGWISGHLEESDEHKVLLFVQDWSAAKDVAEQLRAVLGPDVVSEFHAKIPEDDLAQIAFDFQHKASCRVLVSDELGGEGRNFQSASAVVHLDLPLSTTRVEQRIGRLDRIGRNPDSPVESVTVTGPLAAEQVLLEAHAEVFGVFERTVGGLEFVLPRLQRELAVAYAGGDDTLREAIPSLRDQVNDARQAIDDAFELSLDATKPQLDKATRQAEHLDDAVPAQIAQKAVTAWARRLGMKTRPSGPGTCEFQWEVGDLRVHVPGVSDRLGGFLRGTFERANALDHENLQFLGPGHYVIDGILASLSKYDLGRATALGVRTGGRSEETWILQVLIRTHVSKELWDAEGTTASLALRAQAVYPPQTFAELVTLSPGTECPVQITTDAQARNVLSRPARPDGCFEIGREQFLQLPYARALLETIPEAAELARSTIANQIEIEGAAQAQRLENELWAELGWLRWQANQNSDAGKKAAAELRAREAILESVRRPTADIEGVALICLC